MRQSLAWAAVLSLVVLACNGTGSGLIGIATSGGGTDTTGLTATVRIENFAFNPTVVNLQRGGVVTWVWALDTVSHNVTFSDPSLTSPTQSVGTHTVVFTAQGTFTYRCTIHSGMNGSVVVR